MTQLFILLLAIFGGAQFFTNQTLAWFIMAYMVFGLIIAIKRPCPPLSMSIFRWPVVMLILSALVTFNGWWTVLRLWLVSAALMLGLLKIDHNRLRVSILTVGFIYSWFWIVGPGDHRNIVALWPLIFASTALGSPKSWWRWPYLGLQAAVLLWLGGRGAILGLAATCAAYYIISRHGSHITATASLVATISAVLAMARINTSMVRVSYWESALKAFLSAPIFGLGPGGIIYYSKDIIFGSNYSSFVKLIPSIWNTETNTGNIKFSTIHLHAHNIIISLLAEGGMAGLAGLVMAARQAWYIRNKLHFETWQITVLISLAVYSMVDEPLWWPGPLLLAALVVGSIGEKQNDRKDDSFAV